MGGYIYELTEKLFELAEKEGLSAEDLAESLDWGKDFDVGGDVEDLRGKTFLDIKEHVLKLIEHREKNNIEKIFEYHTDKIAQKIIDDIVYIRASDSWKTALDIKTFIEHLKVHQSVFCNRILPQAAPGFKGMNPNQLSKLLTKLKNDERLGSTNTTRLNEIKYCMQNHSSFNGQIIKQNDIAHHLDHQLEHEKLTDSEIYNLCGQYIIIHRKNYKESDDKRVLYISTIQFYLDKDGIVKFHYAIQTPLGKNYIASGFVIRDTFSSLKGIGFYSDSNKNNASMFFLGLSISPQDLIEGKKYINGGIFWGEADLKPYHTWAHLSKIDDINVFEASVCNNPIWKKNIQRLDDVGFFTFMITMKLESFNINDERVNYLLSIVLDNYKDYTTPESIVEYIVRKMYLDEKVRIPHHAI